MCDESEVGMESGHIGPIPEGDSRLGSLLGEIGGAAAEALVADALDGAPRSVEWSPASAAAAADVAIGTGVADEHEQARRELRGRVMRLLADVLAVYDDLVPLMVELNELDVLCDDTPFVRGWLDAVDGVLALVDEHLHYYGAIRGGGRGGLSPLRLQLARDAAQAAGGGAGAG